MLLSFVTPGHFSHHNGKAMATRRRSFQSIKYFIIKSENSLKIYCYENNIKDIPAIRTYQCACMGCGKKDNPFGLTNFSYSGCKTGTETYSINNQAQEAQGDQKQWKLNRKMVFGVSNISMPCLIAALIS